MKLQWKLYRLSNMKKRSCCEDCIENRCSIKGWRCSLIKSSRRVKEHSRPILHYLAGLDFWRALEIRRSALYLIDCRRMKGNCELAGSCRHVMLIPPDMVGRGYQRLQNIKRPGIPHLAMTSTMRGLPHHVCGGPVTENFIARSDAWRAMVRSATTEANLRQGLLRVTKPLRR